LPLELGMSRFSFSSFSNKEEFKQSSPQRSEFVEVDHL